MKKLTFTIYFVFLLLSCRQQENNEDNKLPIKNSYYDKAWEFNDKQMPDSAFYYFNLAKEYFHKFNDSLGTAKSLCNMGIIAYEAGDFFGSQELSLESNNYLNAAKKNEREIISSNYNNLGNTTNGLGKHNEAVVYFKSALSFTNTPQVKELYHNNIGIISSYLKQYNEAILHLSFVIKNQASPHYARALSNVGKVRWLKDPSYNPLPLFYESLAIRTKENNQRGLNASFAHLADYYSFKNRDSATFFAQQMLKTANIINSPDDQLEALEKLISLSNNELSKSYFSTYKNLADSVKNARNAAKNQFALIRYETEKQKAANLKLQKENAAKSYQIVKREIILYGTLISIAIATFLTFRWYQKRKQVLALEVQNAIRENQLKTSKKVHDVVANGLYRVMAEVENNATVDRGNLLDKIEDLYEKSRDISYEEVTFIEANFHEKIAEMVTSFANENTKVLLVGNSFTLWANLSSKTKYEVEHILQELMVNMKKHSMASNVLIRFEAKDDQIEIFYVDNGIGLPKAPQFKNGLTNTGNRIQTINGAITFDTKEEKGLKIQLSFPVS